MYCDISGENVMQMIATSSNKKPRKAYPEI
jgi:hypothetical protein